MFRLSMIPVESFLIFLTNLFKLRPINFTLSFCVKINFPSIMVKIVYILVGGAIGTYLRYAVSGYSYKLFDWIFPIGTLVVNLIGSFLIGLLWGIFESGNLSPNIRVFIFIGILGGFTTFSSYMLETLNLYRDGEVRLAIINLLANNIFGLIMVIGGFFLSKLLVGQLK